MNNGPADSFLPEHQRPIVDYVNDGAVAPIGTTGFVPRVSSESAAAFGSGEFYFQAGNIVSAR